MDRRTYLRRVGTVTVPLVAGCAGDGDTDETTAATTGDQTPTAAQTTAEPTTARTTTATSAPTTTTGTADPATTTGTTDATTDATATDTADATTTATATPTTTTTPQTTVAADVAIDIAGLAYDPVRTSADVGDTVVWTNQDGAGHNVVSAQFTDAATEWSYTSSTLTNGERTTYTFESAGAFEYYCSIHGRNTMCGVVVVGDATHEASLPCEG